VEIEDRSDMSDDYEKNDEIPPFTVSWCPKHTAK
jgi:hypothetical protein